MPAVHAHAIALAGQGKDALQANVRAQLRERLHAEAVTWLQAAAIGSLSYDMVLRSLVEKDIHFGEINKIDCSRSALRSLGSICCGGLEVGRTRAHYQ